MRVEGSGAPWEGRGGGALGLGDLAAPPPRACTGWGDRCPTACAEGGPLTKEARFPALGEASAAGK